MFFRTNGYVITVFVLLLCAGPAFGGSNSNATVSLDLIANGGAGNQIADGVTSGTVSGTGTTIAVEIFATGVTTPLAGLGVLFDFDPSVLKFDKAENSAFAFSIPDARGVTLAATTPVTLGASGFLVRAEFSTVVDVTNKEFRLGIGTVTLSESATSSDEITTTDVISFNTPSSSSPDFDGDETVGVPDFLLFVAQFGLSQGDAGYDARFDLDGNGAIGIPDFLIFVNNFGKEVPSSGGGGGGGGGSSSPDLIVESPSVSDSSLTAGQSFTLSATVRNQGTGASASTTLRYYRSSDATISTSDTAVGTDSVSGLSASGTSAESISLNAPSSAGTYYYGGCVESVSGESDTDNNCSDGVRAVVAGSSSSGDGNTRATAFLLALDSSLAGQDSLLSLAGRIETSGAVDYFKVEVSNPGLLLVYTTAPGRGRIYLKGTLEDSKGDSLVTQKSSGNFRIVHAVSAGTYYVKVEGHDDYYNTGSYTIHASLSSRVTAPLLALGDSLARKIETSGDVDYFKVEVSNPGLLLVYTTAPGRGRIYLKGTLEDSNGDSLATQKVSGNFRIVHAVSAGTYYVKVEGHGYYNTGSYTIHASLSSRATAPVLALDSSLAGQDSLLSLAGRIETSGDVDYFKVEVSNPGLLLVYTTAPGRGRIYLKGTLEDSKGDSLVTQKSSGNFRIVHAVSAGTYYVKVEGHGYYNTGSYTIHASVISDHSNTRATATPLPLGDSLAGQIEPAGDVDYFKVEVSNSGKLTVYTTGSSDTKGTLEDNTGTVLVTEDDGGFSDNFRIRHSVSPGTYYVKVEGGSSSGTGVYIIRASVNSNRGTCSAGLIVQPGGSCTWAGLTFSVSSTGRGSYGFSSAGTGITMRNTTINGVTLTFVASKNADNSWTIQELE